MITDKHIETLKTLKKARETEGRICPYCLLGDAKIVQLEHTELNRQKIKDQVKNNVPTPLGVGTGAIEKAVDSILDFLMTNALKCPRCGQRALMFKTDEDNRP